MKRKTLKSGKQTTIEQNGQTFRPPGNVDLGHGKVILGYFGALADVPPEYLTLLLLQNASGVFKCINMRQA